MRLGRLFQREPAVYHDDGYEGGWMTIQVHCYGCAHIWWAICPSEADQLQCPRCRGFTLIVNDEAADG